MKTCHREKERTKKGEVGVRGIWRESDIKKEKEKECPLKSQMFCSALLHSRTSVVYRVLRSRIPGVGG